MNQVFSETRGRAHAHWFLQAQLGPFWKGGQMTLGGLGLGAAPVSQRHCLSVKSPTVLQEWGVNKLSTESQQRAKQFFGGCLKNP